MSLPKLLQLLTPGLVRVVLRLQRFSLSIIYIYINYLPPPAAALLQMRFPQMPPPGCRDKPVGPPHNGVSLRAAMVVVGSARIWYHQKLGS